MSSYTPTSADRHLTAPVPPYRDSEKGQESPLLVSVPSYESIYTATLAPAPLPQAATPPRRSSARKICVRASHFLLLTALFIFAIHSLYPKIKGFAFNKQGSVMHGTPATASSHPDCVKNARWTNHDEELEHHHALDIYPHDFRHLVKTSFNLPLNSDLLYFLAHGVLSHGSIEIVDDGENGDDKVVVDVAFLYVHDVALEKVEVCHLQREQTKNGVGIFSPSSFPPHRYDEYRSHFSVVVHLPNGSGNKHFYPALETDMPNFVHRIGDLDQSATFHTVDIKTTNTPIHIQSLTVANGRIKTTNGPIEGKVVASSFLDLRSSNGPLKTDVTLSNRGGTETSKLVLSTSNSLIRASISLISLTADATGGSFDIDAHTSNGPVDIVYPVAPVDSILKFEAHSSNSPVHATLHKTYEGKFSLKSSRWAQPALLYDDGVEDPAGRGRQRVVETHSVGKGFTDGNVHWRGGNSGMTREGGSVALATSNAIAQLTL